jgi:hypothetical protein
MLPQQPMVTVPATSPRESQDVARRIHATLEELNASSYDSPNIEAALEAFTRTDL